MLNLRIFVINNLVICYKFPLDKVQQSKCYTSWYIENGRTTVGAHLSTFPWSSFSSHSRAGGAFASRLN